MTELTGLIEIATQAQNLVADFQQVTLYDEEIREPAIRGFIIVGCFVVLPVAVAWFFERCSNAYEHRHGIADD
jgi:hypothetical protein